MKTFKSIFGTAAILITTLASATTNNGDGNPEYTSFADAADRVLHYPKTIDNKERGDINIVLSYNVQEDGKLKIHQTNGCESEIANYVVKELDGIDIKDQFLGKDSLRYAKIILRLL